MATTIIETTFVNGTVGKFEFCIFILDAWKVMGFLWRFQPAKFVKQWEISHSKNGWKFHFDVLRGMACFAGKNRRQGLNLVDLVLIYFWPIYFQKLFTLWHQWNLLSISRIPTGWGAVCAIRWHVKQNSCHTLAIRKKERKNLLSRPMRCMKLVSRGIRWCHKLQYKQALTEEWQEKFLSEQIGAC